jgi:hypothetical protein
MGDYHTDRALIAQAETPVQAAYRRRLEARVGRERAREIPSVSRFNSIVYPTYPS